MNTHVTLYLYFLNLTLGNYLEILEGAVLHCGVCGLDMIHWWRSSDSLDTDYINTTFYINKALLCYTITSTD